MPSSLRRRIASIFQGAGSASGVASVAAVGGYGASASWQLASGHYVPAKMQPVIIHPRPDSETNSWERHRMAPDGIEWSIPLVMQGGSWPDYWEITTGPSGMVCELVLWSDGQQRYWQLRWPTPTIGTHAVTVTLKTQETGRNTSGFVD